VLACAPYRQPAPSHCDTSDHEPCLALSLSLLGSAAQAADATKPSPFPDLPYAKRWVFKPSVATKPGRPSDGRTALRYNPICVNPDLPCNGDPSDYYNEGSGWSTAFEGSMAINAVLEPVYVGGFAQTPGWTVVCRRSECREYRDTVPNVLDESPAGLQEFIIEKTVGDNKADACAAARSSLATPEQKSILQGTTSQDGADSRQTAARAAVQASGLASYLSGKFATSGIGPSGLLHKWAYGVNKGYTVTVTFSDGGT